MISSILYKAIINPKAGKTYLGKMLRHLAILMRLIVLRISDPPCDMEVHGTLLQMPLSHPLPTYLFKYPQYDSVIGRISGYLRHKHGNLISIDIGANIGDTIAALRPQEGDWILAAEPFPYYLSYLHANVARFQSKVTVVSKACVEEPSSSPVEIRGTNGTGAILESKSGSIKTTTLNELVDEYPDLTETRFLKIDVDGHDFSVVRGGIDFIAKVKPVIFMESDIFENTNYVDDVLSLCKSLSKVGYRHLIAYDHQGGLIHATSLDEASTMLPILFYQTSRGSLFLDLLFGTDLKEFFDSELHFFNTSSATKTRTAASTIAATRWQEFSPLGK